MIYDDVSWEDHKLKSQYVLRVGDHIIEFYAPKPKFRFDIFEIQFPEESQHPIINTEEFNFTFGKTTWTFYKHKNKKKISSGNSNCQIYISHLERFNFDGSPASFKKIFIKLFKEDPNSCKMDDYPTVESDFTEFTVNNHTWISYECGDDRNFRCFFYYLILGNYTLNFSFNFVGILERDEDFKNFNRPLLDKIVHGFLETVNGYKVGSPEANSLPKPGIYTSNEELTKDISYTGL